MALEFLGKCGGAAGEGGGAAEALRSPEHIEPDDIRGKHRAQRRQHIGGEANKEEPLAAMIVGQRA